jgi:DNA-directed RNA polymerase subunit RPC12/RpoP
MTEYCSICGEPLEPDEEAEGICRNCQSSMLADADIPPTF